MSIFCYQLMWITYIEVTMLNSLAFNPIKKMNQQVSAVFKKPYMKHTDLQFYLDRKII